MRIVVKRTDVVWNYIGTVVSMASGFVLLPLLLVFLSADELGLWYVFLAVSNLTLLFEFGFNPTFARNIVYVVNGARRLARRGCDVSSVEAGIDWHLLKTVMRTSKRVYAAIAILSFVLVATLGSFYIARIAQGLEGVGHWVSWGIFCVSIFLNLYYLYFMTYLRGVGDIAGENRAKTYAKCAQLALSAILLMMGFGLVGASIGFLVNGLLLRILARRSFRKHREIVDGLAGDSTVVSKGDFKNCLSSISFIAWRDGVVQLSGYASTQATSIVCSLFLSLAETGTYSVLLQLGNAVCSLASAYARSCLPMFQSAYAQEDVQTQRSVVERGTAVYWVLFLVGTVGVLTVIFPLLPVFKPGLVVSVPVFAVLSLYLALWNQHSMYCCFIVSRNEIPYMGGYLVSAILGIALSVALMQCAGWGIWGLIIGQMAVQLSFNNWYWPRYVVKTLGTTYFFSFAKGVDWCWRSLSRRVKAAARSRR